jgi:hypothetical protein
VDGCIVTQIGFALQEYRRSRRWQLAARTFLMRLGAIAAPPAEEDAAERAFDVVSGLAFGEAGAAVTAAPAAAPSGDGAAASLSPDAAGSSGTSPDLGALGLSLTSAPEDVRDALEALARDARDVRAGTREEVFVRRQLQLARWTARAAQLAARITRHRDRTKDAVVQVRSGASSWCVHARTRARVCVCLFYRSIMHHSRFGGYRPCLGTLLQCIAAASINSSISEGSANSSRKRGFGSPFNEALTVSSVALVKAPSAITWEAFMARRLTGPAAIIAAGKSLSDPT